MQQELQTYHMPLKTLATRISQLLNEPKLHKLTIEPTLRPAISSKVGTPLRSSTHVVYNCTRCNLTTSAVSLDGFNITFGWYFCNNKWSQPKLLRFDLLDLGLYSWLFGAKAELLQLLSMKRSLSLKWQKNIEANYRPSRRCRRRHRRWWPCCCRCCCWQWGSQGCQLFGPTDDITLLNLSRW